MVRAGLYMATAFYVICRCAVSALVEIYATDKLVWQGTLPVGESGGLTPGHGLGAADLVRCIFAQLRGAASKSAMKSLV